MRDFLIAVGVFWLICLLAVIWMAVTAPLESEIWENGEPRG